MKKIAVDERIFYHGIKHAGEPVTAGVKYVLRTDIMFKTTG